MRPVPLSLYCTHLSALPSVSPSPFPAPLVSRVICFCPSARAHGLRSCLGCLCRTPQLAAHERLQASDTRATRCNPTHAKATPSISAHSHCRPRPVESSLLACSTTHPGRRLHLPPLSAALTGCSVALPGRSQRLPPRLSLLSLFFSSPSFPPASKSSGLHHPKIFLSFLSRCLLILCWSTAHPLPSGPCSLKLGSGVIS